MKVKFLAYLYVIISFLSCTVNPKTAITPDKKPNIIFIISDDQAYGDYSFMGHQQIQTPHIDKLAKESMTFTRGYASAPLCSPSLASIITGLYAYQHGITGNDPVVENYEGPKHYGRGKRESHFPANSYPVKRDNDYQKLKANFYKKKLITQTLSENGYRSFQSGKWWIGSAEEGGFDKGMTHGDYKRGGRHGDEGLKIGREGLKPVTDFIDETTASNQPFFVWYAPFLPHTPHTPPKALEEKYLKLTSSPHIAKYWAMVEWFDQTTGELLNYLKDKGLEENTIIVYTCDNGWIQSDDSSKYAARSKRAPHEGGIRTPVMFKYPKKIQAQMNTENLVSNVDIVPTVLSLLGLEEGNLTGINVLDESALKKRKTIFAESYNHDITNVDIPTESILYKIAVEKDWKLIFPNNEMVQKEGTTEKEHYTGYYSKDPQLFNLADDPNELKNVAEQYPEEVQRLTDKINDWWQPEIPERPKPTINPPKGRVAIVADGNSPDPDDLGGTAISLALLRAAGLEDRLVHYSHSCDLVKNQPNISEREERERHALMQASCDVTARRWGGFDALTFFDAKWQKEETVKDLANAINASTANDPLWIVEAGEPDIIGLALDATPKEQHQFVKVVTHHPANDNTGDFYTWQQILDYGIEEVRIPDQNTYLKVAIEKWDWARDHPDARIQQVWLQGKIAEVDNVVKFQKGKWDCSDAGMILYWITGATSGGLSEGRVGDVKALLLDYVARNSEN
ncbi:MAG: sulfatase [Saprospiraceae bacterium]